MVSFNTTVTTVRQMIEM